MPRLLVSRSHGRALVFFFGSLTALSACNALFDIDAPMRAAAGAGGEGDGATGGSGGVAVSGGSGGSGGVTGGSGGKGGSLGGGAGGATGGTGGGKASGGRGGTTGGSAGDLGEGGAETGGTGGASAGTGGTTSSGGSAGSSAAGVGGTDGGTAGTSSGGTAGKSTLGPCENPMYRAGELVLIPGGVGVVGADDINENTIPVINPTFEDFCIDRTEVTVADYADCIADSDCTPQGSTTGCNTDVGTHGDHPVNCVSQAQAAAFCAWANKRLPTEKEWEYAARGSAGRKYPWGPGDPNTNLLNYNNSIGATMPVGSYPNGNTPSTGLEDMGGNVWEWTASEWCEDYSAMAACTPGTFIARGGSFASTQANFVRPSWRDPDSAGDNRFGFRCAAEGGNNP